MSSSTIDVTQLHKQQDNVETSGSKCNRCAYDIIWDKPTAEKLFGKNRPFESDNITPHTCDKDSQGNPIVRKGYAIRDGKAYCLNPVQVPQSNKGQQQLSVAPADVQPQIIELIKQIESLKILFGQAVAKQNQDIMDLKAIVQNYTEHNPFAATFSEMVDKMLKYLPDPELGPQTADTLASMD